MTGAELRAARMELSLLQGNLASALRGLGLAMPDGQQIDQPAISMMERGKVPVPDAVAAAIQAGQVPKGSDSPPVVGQGRTRPAASEPARPRKSRSRKEPSAAPAASPAAAGNADGQGADAEPASPPPPAEPEPEPTPEPAPRDRPPAVPARVGVTFSEAARSQLEADLRKLFAGDTFLVPVEVRQPDGSKVIEHHDGHIPGLAQLVGQFDAYDGRVIELNAASMARAWADLAAENPTVRRILMGATYGGAWRGVIAATLPVLTSIAMHHGMAMPGFMAGAAAPVTAAEPPADGVAAVA